MTAGVLSVALDGVPWEMREEPRWGGWRMEYRRGNPTKVPISVLTGSEAASTRPEEWVSWPQATSYFVRHRKPPLSGLGFRLGEYWAGVDLDGCRNADTGEIHPWAQRVVDRLGSYTEVSPSGTGLKVFLVAQLPSQQRHKTANVPIKAIEMYDSGRYFTVTGRGLPGTPTVFAERSPELEELYYEIFPKVEPSAAMPSPPPMSLDDNALVSKLLGARNGAKAWQLWQGNASAYGSASEADLALVSMIAFYTGPDTARIDRLFRQSHLYRDKWDERHGDKTMAPSPLLRH